jgi:hypothetical protein
VQVTPFSSNEAGTVWLDQVLVASVASVVAHAMPLAKLSSSPTAQQSLVDPQATASNSSTLLLPLIVSSAHVVPLFSVPMIRVPFPFAKHSVVDGQVMPDSESVPPGSDWAVQLVPLVVASISPVLLVLVPDA